MQFTTRISIAKTLNPIDYDSQILSVGSCFAVNISEKFDYYNFQNLSNPFGILFHPLAILRFFQRAIQMEEFSESDLFQHNDLWHCFDLHSDWSQPNKEQLLETINAKLESAKNTLENASHIIVTYGTSWVYVYNQSKKTVANCHKIAQSNFTKRLLTVAEIETAIEQTLTLIHSVNPNCEVIFTVSPVRHIKDGFVENQRSKAHLIAAIHQSITNRATYFPSYEIMMDELRDYRFYAEDMLHPNNTAVDYIWEHFSGAYISDGTKRVMEEVSAIRKAMQHKPFHPESQSHQKFLSKLEQQKAVLRQRFPHFEF